MVGELILIALFPFAFVLTAIYLLYFRKVQRTMEVWLPEFWQSVGAPRGFNWDDLASMMSVLYTSELTRQFSEVNSAAELLVVRILLPVSTLLNLSLIVIVFLFVPDR